MSGMLAAARRQAILDLAVQQQMVKVDELAHRFGVTTETIRRDLDALAETGLLVRTHGGAVIDFSSEAQRSYAQREQLRAGAKQRIARAALELLPAAGTVVIDAGSTTTAFAGLVAAGPRLTVVTNAMTVSYALAKSQADVFLLGGHIRWESFAAIGPRTMAQLGDYRFDVAFMGCNSMDPEGFYTVTEEEALTKAAMMARAKKVILLADAAKFRPPDFARMGVWKAVDLLVTDEAVPAAMEEVFARAGVEVRVAPGAGIRPAPAGEGGSSGRERQG